LGNKKCERKNGRGDDPEPVRANCFIHPARFFSNAEESGELQINFFQCSAESELAQPSPHWQHDVLGVVARRLWEKILSPLPNCNAVENRPAFTS